MTGSHDPKQGVGPPCPGFEALSCFADGELEAESGTRVAVHVTSCAPCRALANRLRAGFGSDQALRGGGIGGSGCIGEERLVLYAMSDLAADERGGIAAHLGGCDGCVSALQRVRNRLRAAVDTPQPVPASVQRRAEAALAAAARELAAEAPPVRPALAAGDGVLERVRAWLRAPVLIPVAAVGAAVLMMSLGRLPVAGPTGTEHSRALPPQTVRLRVVASEALVYSRPSGQSSVLATVRHGTQLEVAGEERGWYEVRLDGGQSGWIVREAFE